MKSGKTFGAMNGHTTKELLGGWGRRPSKPVPGATAKHAAIYVCLAVFFAFCWFAHYLAFLKMEGWQRQFVVMNERALHVMALMDWIAANSWLAIAYVVLVVAAVAFAQVRGHPTWSCWLTALMLCMPCILYGAKCVCIFFEFHAGLL